MTEVRGRKPVGLPKIVLAGAILATLLAEPAAAVEALAVEPASLGVGNRFPAVDLKTLAGAPFRIAGESPLAKATVLFFYAPQCAECFQEMNFFDALYRKTRDLGFDICAVEGTGLDTPQVKEMLEGYSRVFGDPAFPIAADPAYRLSGQLGVRRLPTTFLIESHGVVLSRREGFTDADAVDTARTLERLLKLESRGLAFAVRNFGISEQDERSIEESLERKAQTRKPVEPAVRMPGPGEPAPAFTYNDLAGRARQWPAEKGSRGGMILFFWGALCLPCIQEMAYLEEVYDLVKDQGLEIIAVEASGLTSERTTEVMEQYRKFYPLPSYSIVPDPGHRLGQLYGVGASIPQTLIINREGVVVAHTDEFIQGPTNPLTRKIEMAFNLEPGYLGQRRVSGKSPSLLSPAAGEAPSVLKNEKERDEFQHNLLQGDAYYREWSFDKALPHYLRCLALEPHSVGIRERVARIYERRGEIPNAIKQWQEVLSESPNHPDARSQIESLKQSAGKQ